MAAEKNYYEKKEVKSETMVEFTLLLAGMVIVIALIYFGFNLIVSK